MQFSRVDLFIQGHGDEHDPEYHQAQDWNGGDKPQSGFRVDGEGHDHRAEYDKGRTEQQPKRQIQTGLYLIHVRAHTGDQGGDPDPVEGLVGKALDMAVEHVAELRGKAHGGFGGKILGRYGKQQTDEAQSDQKKRHSDHIGSVRRLDAPVDDSGNDQRHEQLKRGLQELEQRPENSLKPVLPKVFH